MEGTTTGESELIGEVFKAVRRKAEAWKIGDLSFVVIASGVTSMKGWDIRCIGKTQEHKEASRGQ